MSEIQMQQQNDPLIKITPDDQEVSNSYETSSVTETSAVSEDNDKFLNEIENRNSFLKGFGMNLFFYAILGFAMILFIKLDKKTTKFIYRTLRLDKYVFSLVYISLAIKLIMGFISKFLFFLSHLFYLIDCILYPIICLGLWFHFEETQRLYLISRAYMVVVFTISFATLSFFYLISTFIKHKKYKYNFYTGFLLMLISTMITVKVVDNFWLHTPMIWQIWIITVILNLLVIVYLCMFSYLVVNFRINYYKTSETLLCYWNFWIDWFSFMWLDFVNNSKFMRKQKKKRERDQRRIEKLQRKNQFKKKQQQSEQQQNDMEQISYAQSESSKNDLIVKNQPQQNDLIVKKKPQEIDDIELPEFNQQHQVEQNKDEEQPQVQVKNIEKSNPPEVQQQQPEAQKQVNNDKIEESNFGFPSTKQI